MCHDSVHACLWLWTNKTPSIHDYVRLLHRGLPGKLRFAFRVDAHGQSLFKLLQIVFCTLTVDICHDHTLSRLEARKDSSQPTYIHDVLRELPDQLGYLSVAAPQSALPLPNGPGAYGSRHCSL